MTNESLQELWDQQSIWSQAATRVKRGVGRGRSGSLILISFAAIFGALSGSLGLASAFAAAACIALTPFVRRSATHEKVQDWTRMRSVSEALKAEIYQYLARVMPYEDDASRDRLLHQRTADVLSSASDLLPYTSDIKAALRDVPAIHDVDTYIEKRLIPEIQEYYLPQASLMGRRAKLADRIQFGLATTAALLGAASSYLGAGAAPWLGVLATISGAVTAHAASSRYSLLQLEYLRSAQYLQLLLEDQSNRDSLVSQSEHVISVQNEGWMAKLVSFDAGSAISA